MTGHNFCAEHVLSFVIYGDLFFPYADIGTIASVTDVGDALLVQISLCDVFAYLGICTFGSFKLILSFVWAS